MSLTVHRQRQLQAHSRDVLGETAPWLGPLERRVLTELLVRTARGWRLFVRSGPPRDGAAMADAFLVGPGGVFSVTIAETPPDEQTARAVCRHAEDRCAGIRGPGGDVLTQAAVGHVVVMPGADRRLETPSGLYRLVTEADLGAAFRRDETSLGRRRVEMVAGDLAARLNEYRQLTLPPPEFASEERDAGLLGASEVREEQLTAAQQRPFETWMSFLHPTQQALVTRDYSGPARISGPAGTGKTVVALHRLRHLARRSTGPLLFTTFVRSLPAVYETVFRRLAPELADRVQFINLHAWIREFLAERGSPVRVHRTQVDTAFGYAWLAHRGPLERLEPSPDYWRTEIDRVIKGRGLATLEDYIQVTRRGRTVRLDPGQKAHVWRLYEAYQDHLNQKGIYDYNDLITLALDELAARPLQPPYAGVVVDEVQDITLIGLRLLRDLSGNGPNRLLLVGDGQQQVYPGGWRLSEAGIPVRGRGEVLRVNYRNRAAVLDFARGFDARNQMDDLDGAPGVALGEAEVANPGGELRRWHGPEAELAAALREAVAALPVPRGQTVVLTFHRRDLDRASAILRRAGIPLQPLEDYTGQPGDALKIGTVHRAKGLDFQAVLAITFPEDSRADGATEQETRELRARQYLVAATRARDYLWWAEVQPDPQPNQTGPPGRRKAG
jgi:hypothetical protein